MDPFEALRMELERTPVEHGTVVISRVDAAAILDHHDGRDASPPRRRPVPTTEARSKGR